MEAQHLCDTLGLIVDNLMNRANTMSSALEVLGMSLPYSSGLPSIYTGSHLHIDVQLLC